MKIKAIRLENFRNYKKEEIFFSGKSHIIVGANAQGKTNLLEAIYLCSTLRSFRGAKEIQMVGPLTDTAQISLTFERKEREHEILLQFSKSGQKEIFLDGRKITRQRDLLGEFQTVIFTPDHLQMLKGGPGGRRAFLDMAICMNTPRYTDALLQYGKALKNRNKVLKEAENNTSLLETLPVWEQMMAREGAYIAKKRAEYIEKLDTLVQQKYSEIGARDGQKTKLLYINCYAKDILSIEEYEQKILERFEKTRNTDIINGITSAGIHKDDFLMLLGGKNIRFFGSQGQIRTGVLALKLSEAQILKEYCGEAPILLLDDILSELDAFRQQYFLSVAPENQCLLTACETDKTHCFLGEKIVIEQGRKQ